MSVKIKKARIVRSGIQYHITIPIAYVRNGIVDIKKYYEVTLE